MKINNQPNPLLIEILASAIHCTEEFLLGHPKATVVTPSEALTAMQRAVEERDAEWQKKYDALTGEKFSERNHVALRQQVESLRTELERVRGYARHHDDCIINDKKKIIEQYKNLQSKAINQHTIKVLQSKIDNPDNYHCTCGLEGGGDV